MTWLILIFLFIPSSLWAAIAYVGEICHASSVTPGNTLVCTAVNVMQVGNPTFFFLGFDNINTTDGDHAEVKSMTDPVGNTYSKQCEYTNSQAGAGNGITVSLWMTLPTAQLAIGQSVTATFSSSITSRAMSSAEFTVGGGMTLQIQGACQTLANDAADAGSMVISGLSSAETLFLRIIANEGQTTGFGGNVTAGYAVLQEAQAAAGTDVTSASITGEYDIAPAATGSASDPTLIDVNDDVSSLFAAFREVSAAVSTRRRGNAWGF